MTPILPSDVDASAPSRVSEKAVEAAPSWVANLEEFARQARYENRHYKASVLGQAAAFIRSALSPIPAAPLQSEAVAWMRKWAFDGINVMALKKADRPRGWSLYATSEAKILDDDVPLYTSPQPVEPAPGAGECETCNGTGMEGRGLICRDCDEPKAIERLTQHEIDAGYTGRMTHSSTYLSAEQQARLGGASPGAGEDAEREAGLVEALAEVIWFDGYGSYRARGGHPHKWPDDVMGGSQELFRSMARAVVRHLSRTRQPTEPKPAQGTGEAQCTPLVWVEVDAYCAWTYAETPVGQYRVTWSFSEPGQRLSRPDGTSDLYPNRDEAKAAAWSHFAALTEQKG